MPDFSNDDKGQAMEGQVVPASPARKLPQMRLGTLREVRREMAKVYGEVRRLKLPSSEGTRLIYMLAQISTQIKDSELEERITKLEKIQDEELRAKNRTY